MANYAVGSSRIDTNPWNQAIASISPAGEGFFQTSPELAYEHYLRSLGLGNTQERTMRQAYSSIWDRYNANDMMRFWGGGGKTDPYRWTEFLQDFDINKELARMGPSGRSEQPERFSQPARWISF